MAIYHLSMKNGGAGKGKNHARYISAEGKYSRKSDMVETLELNIPTFAKNGVDFFAKADEHERKNGRTYKEFELSFPNEFSHEQNVAVLNEFIVAAKLEKQPILAAIHDGRNKQNKHCHLMFSERPNAEFSAEQFFKRNGSKKDRTFHDKSYLSECRKEWENILNDHLFMNGFDQKVSCETLEKQGIDRLPQPKIGYAAMNIEAKNPGQSKRVQRFEEVMKFNSDKAIEFQKQETLSRDPNALDNLILRFEKLKTLEHKTIPRPAKPERLTFNKVMNSSIRKEESGFNQFKQTKQLLDVQYEIAKETSWFNPFAKVKAMLEYNKTFDEFEPVKETWLSNKKDLQKKVSETNKNRALKYKREMKEYQQKREDLKQEISDMKQSIESDFGSLDKAEHLARQRYADLEPQRKAEAEQQRQRSLEIAEQQRLSQQREQLREQLQERENSSSFDLSM